MAFQSNGPVTLSLPPFRGVTRQIILTTLIVFFSLGVLGIAVPGLAATLRSLGVLVPDLAVRGAVWQFLTYPFVGEGLLSVGFALLSVWFFASSLEDERGGRWLMEYFLVTTIGGGLLASLLTVLLGEGNRWIPFAATAGLWPFVLAVIVAFAYFHPDAPLRFQFIFTVKAKYLAAIYVAVYLALSLRGVDHFGAVVALVSALCGFLFVRFAPRRGVRVGGERALVRAAQCVLSCQAEAGGEEVCCLHEEAGQGCQYG